MDAPAELAAAPPAAATVFGTALPQVEAYAALLAGPDSTRGGRFMAGTALRETPSLVGQRLGAYTLEAPLGQGGTGTVWRARRDDGNASGKHGQRRAKLALGEARRSGFGREGVRGGSGGRGQHGANLLETTIGG